MCISRICSTSRPASSLSVFVYADTASTTRAIPTVLPRVSGIGKHRYARYPSSGTTDTADGRPYVLHMPQIVVPLYSAHLICSALSSFWTVSSFNLDGLSGGMRVDDGEDNEKLAGGGAPRH